MRNIYGNKNTDFSHLSKIHPCLSREANSNSARVHLPVSAACNIQCKFCKRDCNNNEERPGVAKGILAPKDALKTIKKALELCPQITVVGIAGPGDTLATPDAIETFKIIDKEYPSLVKCLSTNGLLLYKYAQDIYDAGVRTVTVTVNAVDPYIQSRIISYIVYKGKKYYGEEAAQILIDNQLRGINKMSKFGAIVKVNSVLIPGINDEHIAKIAKTVKDAGAFLYNIIPLIPEHELSHISAPSCEQLDKARIAAEEYIQVFRHCKHCRADACGIPGKKDFSNKLYETHNYLETFSHG
ncbi:radical SAM protein [Clostridium magnum]|uniref:FeMo cofactor biosynthesis protein NifB n=1 Tax=Clostridium magnum DSM 2767 TaxID=1121326 RepID=A0A161X9Z0_9CLOT|nr:radical SAM protein [Clostridium magnum]KZL91076.1 FeMo cofactor biosynthesis protein NifB [Clostridium magnum DSM 2767]SHI06500.1 nitrogen fixation protein NifB [Clostridium magnum DSM 2767]